jgi:hypothetical protein
VRSGLFYARLDLFVNDLLLLLESLDVIRRPPFDVGILALLGFGLKQRDQLPVAL